MPQRKRAAAEVAEKKVSDIAQAEYSNSDIPDEEKEKPIAGAAAKAKLVGAGKKNNGKPIAGAAAREKLESEGKSSKGNLKPETKASKLEHKEKKADEIEKAQTADFQESKGSGKLVCVFFYFS